MYLSKYRNYIIVSLAIFTAIINIVSYFLLGFNLFDISFAIFLICFSLIIKFSNRFDLLRPDVAVFVMTFISYYINYNITYSYFLVEYNKNMMIYSLNFILMCIFFYIIGFNFFSSFWISKYNNYKSSSLVRFIPNIKVVKILIVINIFLKTLFVSIGYKSTHTAAKLQSSYLDILVVFQSNLFIITIFLILYYYNKKKNSTNFKILIYIFFILSVIFAILSGSRGELILSLAFPLMFYNYYYKGKFNIKYIIYSMVFLLFFIPISLLYRQEITFGNKASISISEKVEVMSDALSELKFQNTSIEKSFEYIFARLGMVQSLYRVVDLTGNSLPYMNGTTIFPHMFISFIPKFIYPDRADTNIGKWFGYTYGFTSSKDSAYISLGMFGELYLNFGFLGFIGAFILGIIHSFFYYKFHKNRNILLLFIIYYLLFISSIFAINEDFIVDAYIKLIKNIIIIFFIWLVLYLFQNKDRLLK